MKIKFKFTTYKQGVDSIECDNNETIYIPRVGEEIIREEKKFNCTNVSLNLDAGELTVQMLETP